MTPSQFRAALVIIGWSQRHVATLLGVDERQARRWAAGAAIPPDIAKWLFDLVSCHEAYPPPA